MRIGILSDSHGDAESLRALVSEMGRLDALCFLGDVSDDARFLQELLWERGATTAFYAVKGNNDFYTQEPEEITVMLGGKRILMVHGHRHGVKQGLLRLSLYARQKEADVALFGHTHMAHVSGEGGLLLINPGAAGKGFWASQPPRGAVLSIEADGGMSVTEVELKMK